MYYSQCETIFEHSRIGDNYAPESKHCTSGEMRLYGGVKITAVKKVCEECETDLKDRFKELEDSLMKKN